MNVIITYAGTVACLMYFWEYEMLQAFVYAFLGFVALGAIILLGCAIYILAVAYYTS